MSNIVDFNEPKRGTVETFALPFPQESELYFQATERDLYWNDLDRGMFHVVPTHKMLLRRGNGAIGSDEPIQLAVVGTGYQLVQNKDLFQAIEAQFAEALTPDELSGVRIHDKMSFGGAMCLREYIFPNVRCDAPGESDVAFRTIVKNGFGGSSIVLYSGAIDFFCTNGMIGGQYDCIYARHTKGLRIGNVTERVRRSIDVFYKQAAIWHRWYDKKITNDEALAFFNDRFSGRLAKRLFRQYLIESEAHGTTMWALYSTMTYYASHDEGQFLLRDTGKDHGASSMLKREEQVRKVVDSDTFARLAA